jgi:hypothetical protein
VTSTGQGQGAAFAAREFIAKWGPGGPAHSLTERAGAQAHFIDLCRLLDVPEPGDADNYCFERGVNKTGGAGARTDGFADVWRRGCFGWEYKGPGKSLEGALRQLMMYALPLENPPLLVVSDRLRIEVHTHFTGTPSERHTFALEDLAQHEVRQRLRAVWLNPESFKPRRSNRDITEEAARTFAETAERLRGAGAAPDRVSHFLTQCVFCFFAEDVGLLPARLFERLVGVAVTPEQMRVHLGRLFETMRDGGLFGVDAVPWFNGGLFKSIDVPALQAADVTGLKAASAMDWSAIDPSIFGTLFERGLDPGKRSQLGAHYTDPTTILRLVEPVVQRPLLAEWASAKDAVAKFMDKSKRHGDKAWRDAQTAFVGFLESLRGYRVLDPACGSGNFLYLALKCIKDIEHQVNLEAEALGLERQHDVTGPHNVLGIELNEYAAELARVTVWIGELQWRIQQGYGFKLDPVLEPLDHIECRDALLDPTGSRSVWPEADAVIGNPPFLGTKKQWGELGVSYSSQLRAAYAGNVPGFADLVCYWFEIARAQMEAGKLKRAGLVATNSIRGGANREVLDRIAATTTIFAAWSDEGWVNEGAAVRVSLVAFGGTPDQVITLDGAPVPRINPDLTHGADVSTAAVMPENLEAAFMATVKAGAFDVPRETALRWLREPNPNGRSSAIVVKRWANGMDAVRRFSETWVIDFGVMDERQAAEFSGPFEHVLQNVKPVRMLSNRKSYRDRWWQMAEPTPKMRAQLAGLHRFIATPVISKHRLFVWFDETVLPDHALIVTARADDATFGILHSRFHELWSLRLGTSLEDRPRYTPTTTFETFPFPNGLSPVDTAGKQVEQLNDGALVPAGLRAAVRGSSESIARAAHHLVCLRDAWLNPPEWSERVPEVVPLGMDRSPYPDRVVARPGFEGELAKRTLTNLYNQRPTWLVQAHGALDTAVAAAYGWTDYTPGMPDDEILRRLLALNRSRAQTAS